MFNFSKFKKKTDPDKFHKATDVNVSSKIDEKQRKNWTICVNMNDCTVSNHF